MSSNAAPRWGSRPCSANTRRTAQRRRSWPCTRTASGSRPPTHDTRPRPGEAVVAVRSHGVGHTARSSHPCHGRRGVPACQCTTHGHGRRCRVTGREREKEMGEPVRATRLFLLHRWQTQVYDHPTILAETQRILHREQAAMRRLRR